jgi:protein-disulfide isomerase-like protein with CxxC motif
MDLPPFSVTWDYLCPFARNVHEHLITGLENGAAWEVTFTPFSLMQAHVEEGGAPVWDAPDQAKGVLALQAGLVVRDRFPDRFLAAHRALFAARHDQSLDLNDRAVVSDALEASGVPSDTVWKEIGEGWPLQALRAAHEESVSRHEVFGVPTFVVGDQAVFVRVMTRPEGNGELARRTIDRVLDLVNGHPEINEYKHTTIPR